MCGIDSEMVVNLMSLPWLDAVTRDVSNFKTKMTLTAEAPVLVMI